jgi:hypothetical protein
MAAKFKTIIINPYILIHKKERIMREVVADVGLVAHCGLYCGACGAYLKERCPGCHDNKKAGWCKIRTCNIANNFSSCAECKEFSDPEECKKFNNIVSKLFAMVFKSNRPACIEQIKSTGLEGHAKKMAALKSQTLKR